jgi:hypothetical protein
MKQQIEVVAQEQGMSIRAYILEAINEKMSATK